MGLQGPCFLAGAPALNRPTFAENAHGLGAERCGWLLVMLTGWRRRAPAAVAVGMGKASTPGTGAVWLYFRFNDGHTMLWGTCWETNFEDAPRTDSSSRYTPALTAAPADATPADAGGMHNSGTEPVGTPKRANDGLPRWFPLEEARQVPAQAHRGDRRRLELGAARRVRRHGAQPGLFLQREGALRPRRRLARNRAAEPGGLESGRSRRCTGSWRWPAAWSSRA